MDDDVQAPVAELLDRLTRLVREARALPVSASCIVNREEVLGLLADLQRRLPEQLSRANALLEDREGVLAEGRAEAARLLERARVQQKELVAETAVHKAAQAEAEQLLSQAREESEALRLEVEDYVDAKLANFEVVLQKTLSAVERGREKLRGRLDADQLAAEFDVEDD